MLDPHPTFPGVPGPVLTVVLDGVGYSEREEGNAVRAAHTPVLDRLWGEYPHTLLRAHGTSVGMPSDADMGNSEVGHNAMGAGQVFAQGAALVSDAIASGRIWEGAAWQEVVSFVKSHDSTLHLIGLVSDGNVHSHVDHLRALIERARTEGIERVRVHALLDGRDVPKTSALEYVEPLEALMTSLSGRDFDARFASGGGRMAITMDRYDANWPLVERGWHTHVLGEGDRFPSASAAIHALRERHPGTIDQDLPPFVVADEQGPVGKVEDGDGVVFFNFRGDRAMEITQAFEEDVFERFDRVRRPRVCFAGMLQYDGDTQTPARYLVDPPTIEHTSGEYLAELGVPTLAISETQKFGHVTYFWNGNRSEAFDDQLETYVEIRSDVIPFEQAPAMKSVEITDELIRLLETGRFKNARVNYPNGDMVGHTGDFDATVAAMEAIDKALGRLCPVIDALQGVMLVTADHGNAEEMFQLEADGSVQRDEAGSPVSRTSHSLGPVPLMIYDNVTGGRIQIADGGPFGLSNLAASIVNLLGYAAPAPWEPGILAFDSQPEISG